MTLEGYVGSKGGSWAYPKLIGEMPVHRVYVEGFAGSAQLYRRKRGCEMSVLVDVDPEVVTSLRADLGDRDGLLVVSGRFLVEVGDRGSLRGLVEDPETLVYLDPPYLEGTRQSGLYAFEHETEIEHLRLLRWCRGAKCRVMISGYRSELYERALAGWRMLEYRAMTRGGSRTECVWLNFGAEERRHEPARAGWDYRERERIKRKARSWAAMYRAMAAGERSAVREALDGVDAEAGW
jgi:DNA adenine methylase